MSTKVIRAGTTFADFAISASRSSRGSGTFTSPTFGSIVQKGKFAACAAAVRVSALNSVDFPTLGSPTIPILNAMATLPASARPLWRAPRHGQAASCQPRTPVPARKDQAPPAR